MSIITLILAGIVALEHLYIMYLETFATHSDTTSRVFNMSKEEGTVHEYWQRRTGSSKPIEPWKQYPCMIRYSAANHTSPQYVFSRSANQDSAYCAMLTSTDGNVYDTSAWNAITYAPLVFI